MSKRLKFCGCIGGSVVIRDGETAQQALARAEETILVIFAKHAKRLSDDGVGPNVCLEIDDNGEVPS